MATFYVMEQKQKHTYTEVLNGLLSNQTYFLDYIKNNQFEEEELAGLKLFLQNNNYNIQLLKAFTEPPILKSQSKKQQPFVKYYKIAAGIVLIISLGFFIKISFSNKTPTNTIYWVEDDGFKVWMSSSNDNTDLLNGISYYKSKNYTEALTYFMKLQNNDTALYYGGISLMHIKKLNKAEIYLSKIPNTSVYKNKSIYYLSLCYLFNHKEIEGLNLLNTTLFLDTLIEAKRKELIIDFKNH